MNRLISAIAAATALVLGTASASGQADACATDIDGDGIVGGADLTVVLNDWGPCKTCDGDVNGDHLVDGVDLAFVLTRWGGTCAPTLDSISPNQVYTFGGPFVVLRGSRLLGATDVTFNGSRASSLSVIDSQTLRVLPPPGQAGAITVRVSTPAGEFAFQGVFSMVAPWFTVVEPRPDAAVVLQPSLRAAIEDTGLPWRIRDIATNAEMLLVPPGAFTMGCSPSQLHPCGLDEYSVHDVTLTRAFYLGRFEVTQAQWHGVTGTNPSRFQDPAGPGSSQLPVESVHWFQVQAFLASVNLRLPTEAEWEYAARGGTNTAFHASTSFTSGTDDDSDAVQLGWFGSHADGKTHAVGLRLANSLGFHDMIGNVGEFVADYWVYWGYPPDAAVDPTGYPNGYYRCVRGGSYLETDSSGVRSSARDIFGTKWPSGQPYIGFRVARNP